MSEYIDRDKVFSIWRSNPAPASAGSLATAIYQTPAADVVGVVRCRDCRWYNAGKNEVESWSDCTLRYGKHFNVNPDDFCSQGERKEAAGD